MNAPIGKLALALSNAQGEIKGAAKDSANPYFKSTYADLASVWEACRKALANNELAVVQTTQVLDGSIILRTILMHSSGELIYGDLPILLGEKATSQQLGSAITYNRRYALAAIVGVAPEDDDGQKASETEGKTKFQKPTVSNPPSPLAARSKAFGEHLDKLRSEIAVNNLVSANNALMTELKENDLMEFEFLSAKINQIIEAFRLADAAK